MSDAALSSRIAGIGQLGSVVRAMTGIASARARTARAQIDAVTGYAASLQAACDQAMAGISALDALPLGPPALVVFCAEQGFVGGFSERVLDCAEEGSADLFLIGSRGAAIAQGRGLVPVWAGPMPSRSAGLPKLADTILGAIFAGDGLRPVSVVHTVWAHGQGNVERHILFPQAPHGSAPARASPLTNLPAVDLVTSLSMDLLHAAMTRAALHAFVAENEARMAAMAAAARQIEEELDALQALARRMRQEAITAEIIEIATGAMGAQ